MKMTKRFEKKLKAFAMRNNLDTNFDWDIGWFDFLYDNFKWMEKYISNHPKFWKNWELFQMAADGCRVVENESWKGPHPDHDNLKFMDKDFWKLTENPIGRNYIGVCYINK